MAFWQISGRAANVNFGTADDDVPPSPFFGLGASQRGGTLELNGVSFTDLTNTRAISAATLTLHYWDELQPTPASLLTTALGTGNSTLSLSSAGPGQPGGIVQIDAEVLRIEAVTNNGTQYQVTRGVHGSPVSAHSAGTPVYCLLGKSIIAPFPPEFFGSPYSGSWSYPVLLPNVRIASAELFVTNNRGSSPTTTICLTGTTDNGLRTLSGGQIDLTVDGVVAIESNAVPAATLPRPSSVRDIFATVEQAPGGSPLTCVVKVSGAAIATLTILTGQVVSNTMDTTTNPSVRGLVIPAGQPITLDITAVGSSYPGKRLTATVRL